MDADAISHQFGEFEAFEYVAPSPQVPGDREQWEFRFPNGFGASVIRGAYTYGGSDGLFELAVLGPDGHLTYSTPITDDVIGHLEAFEVGRLLERIAKLERS